MDYQSIIADIIVKQRRYEVKLNDIKPRNRLYEDIGCDSLDVMEIIMTAEKALKVKIPDENIFNIYRVKDLYKLFENTTAK